MIGRANERVVPAKPSATIVVLRDADPQPEMLLVKRRAGDAFGESYAFPGGVVDDDESVACQFADGTTPDEANLILGVTNGGLDYYSAGIRELFEETGVLLARDNEGDWVCDRPDFEELRPKVDKGLLPWSEFLIQQGLRMSCDALYYFAHWETPAELAKRWSTRFFAAELPAGQTACHDGFETTDSRWLSATEALRQTATGLIDMPYPTVKTLERLQEFATISGLFEWIRTEQESGIKLNSLDSPDGLTRRMMRK